MATREPRTRETWLVAVLGAGILLLIAAKAWTEGERAFLHQRFTCRYALEDDGGHREVVVHQFTGSRARQIGAGLLATALLCALWLLPTLRANFWDTTLPRNRFLRLSLGVSAAAALLIWPPWLAVSSPIALVLYGVMAEFAVWRWCMRGIVAPRRNTLRGLVFMATFMGLGLAVVARLGIEAALGELVAGVLILQLSALRPRAAEAPARSGPSS
jgi:hypothetical protein